MFPTRYFPARDFAPRYFARRGSGAAGADSLIAAIRSRLMGTDTAALGCGTSLVYLNATPNSTTDQYPQVIVNWLNETPDPLTNSQDTYPVTATVQVTVVDVSDVNAMAVRDAAYRSLAPGKPKLWFLDGIDRARLPGMKFQMRQTDVKPGGKVLWCFGFEYRFLIERAY